MSDYTEQVRDYLAYCAREGRKLKLQGFPLDPKLHPSGDGAVKLIWHNADAREAAKIREAFRTLTEPAVA